MPVYKTLTLTEKEHDILNEMVRVFGPKFSKQLILEGRTKGNFERAVQKLYNSQTVHLNNCAR